MNKTDTDALIAKIQKLLALANSDNENEAKAAAEKAQELLVKHNLDLQQVQDKNFEYIELGVAVEPYLRWHQPFLIDLLQEFFFVKVMWYNKFHEITIDGRRKFKKHITLVGTTTNVKIAHYIFDYLSSVYQRNWLEYKKDNELDEKSRKSYYEGLTHGLSHKLDAIRQKVQNQRGLVLVKDPKLDELLKDTTTHKNPYKPDHDPVAQMDGYKHGKDIDIAKPLETRETENKGLRLSAPKPFKIWGGGIHHRTKGPLRVIVRAETKKRALELLKRFQEVPRNYFDNYWSETKNPVELEAATSEGVWSRTDDYTVNAEYDREI